MPPLSELFGEQPSIINWVIQAVFLAFIFVYIFYGQRLQMALWARDVERSLYKIKALRDKAREISISTVKELGKPEIDPTQRIDQFLERFFIEPVSLDPAGIVWKLDHLLNVRDLSMKDEVRRLAPNADESTINSLENLLEAAVDLNFVYRYVRHYYLLSKRTKSYFLLAQLQMIMPIILEQALAFEGAIQAFSKGQPIGDGAGALVANKLARGVEWKKIEKDMIFAETSIDGRKVYALKAEGPGGNVGKPGDAIAALIENAIASGLGKPSLIIMVDAALKFEGEKTGDVAEGIGAAIGGIGVEKFKIEEVANKYKIPLFAVVIKESLKEAISPMRKDIYEGVEKALERIKRIINENTKEGDTVIVAGIGNTIGIA
ncbi:MAG: DUF1512 domain-containing protein [Candidatus Bathyarchaeota archaeon]